MAIGLANWNEEANLAGSRESLKRIYSWPFDIPVSAGIDAGSEPCEELIVFFAEATVGRLLISKLAKFWSTWQLAGDPKRAYRDLRRPIPKSFYF